MRGEDAHFFNDLMGHEHHNACDNVPPGILEHVQCIAPPAPLPQDLELMPPKADSGRRNPKEPKREYDVNDKYQSEPQIAPGGGFIQNPHKSPPLPSKDAFPPALKEPMDPNALRLGTTIGLDPTDPNALLNQPSFLGDPLTNPYGVDVGSWGTPGLPSAIPPQAVRSKPARRGPVDIRKLSQNAVRGPVDIRKIGHLNDDPNIPPMESGVFPEDKGKKSLAGLPSKLLELGVSKRLTKLDRLSRMDDRQMSSKQKAEKRRLMRLEKNRRAAAISRERKKRYIRSLEERSLIMSKHLQVLEMENSQLRALLAQSSNGQELLDTMPPHMSPLPEMSLGLPGDSELFNEQFGVSSPRPTRSRAKASGVIGESTYSQDSFQGQENVNPMKWADPSELKSVFCPGSRKTKSKKRACPSDEEDFAFNGAAPVATAGSSTKLSIKLDDPYPTPTLKTENPPKRTRYNSKDRPPCHRIPKKPKKVGYF